MRIPPLLALVACLSFLAPVARAERVVLEKPVQVSTIKADKSPVEGKLVAYDDDGFELARGAGKTVTVKWSEMGPPGVFNILSTLVGPKAGGEDWVEVGRTMLRVEGGEPFADKAFDRALKVDPKLKEQVETAWQEKPEAEAGEAASAGGGAGEAAPAGAGAGTAGGPQMIGAAKAGAWPPLTEEQRAKKVEELKSFAAEAGKKLNKELLLRETKYFLFYSDLPVNEAQNWAGLLDRMYARLAELFAVPREAKSPGAGRGDYANVWYGKALVFVFQNPDDYRRFQQVVHKTDAGPSAGMCHCFGDGRVHIAFYRQKEELTFAHVLVHESVHGFIHRFRTPAHVPSWANEGLAEVIASELVPRKGRAAERQLIAKQQLQSRGDDLGGLFTARHIEGWQYPVAETMCSYMIQQNKRRYVDFIVGMKEGLTWEQSLEQRYKAPRDRLVRAYRASLGMKK